MKQKRNIFKRRNPQINKEELTSVNIDVEKKEKRNFKYYSKNKENKQVKKGKTREIEKEDKNREQTVRGQRSTKHGVKSIG